jgi:hypothetical protein
MSAVAMSVEGDMGFQDHTVAESTRLDAADGDLVLVGGEEVKPLNPRVQMHGGETHLDGIVVHRVGRGRDETKRKSVSCWMHPNENFQL